MFILWVQLIIMFQSISPSLLSCSNPPAINHTEMEIRASPPFVENSTINYSCLSGYKLYGTGILTCLSGHWIGSFNCTIKKCQSLKPLDHGSIRITCREVGCVINFFCEDGYQRVGADQSYCKVNESWSHAVPECRIMKCPSPPVIEHSNLTQGGSHVYGTKLSVSCNEGFIRSGSSVISCDSNGHWTKAPVCLPSNCPAYPGMTGKCVEKTNAIRIRDNCFLLYIFCIGKAPDRAAVCSEGKWDNLSERCYCDCPVDITSESISFENLSKENSVKHGEILRWRCKDGFTTDETSDRFVCDDGVMETPNCVLKTKNESRGLATRDICLIVIGFTIGIVIIVSISVFVKFKGRKLRLAGHNGMCRTDEETSMLEEKAHNAKQPTQSDNNTLSAEQNGDPDHAEREMPFVAENSMEMNSIGVRPTGTFKRNLDNLLKIISNPTFES